MADITFKHVVKTYDKGNTVVPDLNLEIKDKEFVVLVGPSGCGKSTTLRMIAGLEEVSGGELYIGDRKVNDVPPKDRDIAMVFQSYALYPISRTSSISLTVPFWRNMMSITSECSSRQPPPSASLTL